MGQGPHLGASILLTCLGSSFHVANTGPALSLSVPMKRAYRLQHLQGGHYSGSQSSPRGMAGKVFIAPLGQWSELLISKFSTRIPSLHTCNFPSTQHPGIHHCPFHLHNLSN